MLWHVPDLNRSWLDIANDVGTRGGFVSPRGQRTREILGATIRVEDPTNVLPLAVSRNAHLPIAAAEALQLIGGVSHPELMCRIASKFPNFMDGGVFHGAYGPRVRPQIGSVIRRLSADKDTRQALLTIWDPAQDAHVDGLKDYPCTTVLHFMIRNDRLILHTTMRSNDVYWGLTYDAFQFTQLQLTIADALGIEAGPYYHHANSLHVYERDFAAIDSIGILVDNPCQRQPEWLRGLPGYADDAAEGFEVAASTARDILTGAAASWVHTGPAEDWYIEMLRKYQP